jgi:hypothetical protein
MQTIEFRYLHDPSIKALVDSLEHHIRELRLTPSEIRECAMLAATHYELKRPSPPPREEMHYVQKCEHCGSVIAQCKCTECYKMVIVMGLCSGCATRVPRGVEQHNQAKKGG